MLKHPPLVIVAPVVGAIILLVVLVLLISRADAPAKYTCAAGDASSAECAIEVDTF